MLKDGYKFRSIIILAVILIGFFILNAKIYSQIHYASGEDPETEKKDSTIFKPIYKTIPEKNGFRFIPSDLIKDPFITTYVRSSLGYGTAFDLETIVKGFRGDTLGVYEGDISFLSLELEYQQAINKWLGVYGLLNVSGRISTSVSTLLSSGLTLVDGFTLGGMARIWENDKMFLSGTFSYDKRYATSVSIYNLAKSISEDSTINFDSADFVGVSNSGKFSVSANYSFAPNNFLGFTAVFKFGLGNPFDGKDKGIIETGLATGIDFQNLVNVPLGLLLSYRFNSLGSNGEDILNTSTLSLGLSYTGHQDFNIGMEATYYRFDQPKVGVKINALTQMLKMRYYF